MLSDPNLIAGCAALDELGERHGHIGLERPVKSVLPSIDDAVQSHDFPEIARAKIVSQVHVAITIAAHRRVKKE